MVYFQMLIVVTVIYLVFRFIVIPTFFPEDTDDSKASALKSLKEKEEALRKEIAITKQAKAVEEEVNLLTKELEKLETEEEIK